MQSASYQQAENPNERQRGGNINEANIINEEKPEQVAGGNWMAELEMLVNKYGVDKAKEIVAQSDRIDMALK